MTGLDYTMLVLTFASMAYILGYVWRLADTIWLIAPPADRYEQETEFGPDDNGPGAEVINLNAWAEFVADLDIAAAA